MLLRLTLWIALLSFGTASVLAQGCPQFFPGGQPPVLINPKLGQRTTLLCNDAYAVLTSGITRGPIWS